VGVADFYLLLRFLQILKNVHSTDKRIAKPSLDVEKTVAQRVTVFDTLKLNAKPYFGLLFFC
jgi:hypothetical protein